MKPLEKARELQAQINEAFTPDERKFYKDKLNKILQTEIDIHREEQKLDGLKVELAIESNM